MFDWIPTIGEVVNWVDCRIVGHDYGEFGDADECRQCGKVRK